MKVKEDVDRKWDYKQVIEGKTMWLDGDKALAENMFYQGQTTN